MICDRVQPCSYQRLEIFMLPPSRYTLLPNTAGCSNADDAVRTCQLARELLDGHTLVEMLGCDGVLMNTAIAGARNPVQMAHAMKQAVHAGRAALLAGRIRRKRYASPSNPIDGTIG